VSPNEICTTNACSIAVPVILLVIFIVSILRCVFSSCHQHELAAAVNCFSMQKEGNERNDATVVLAPLITPLIYLTSGERVWMHMQSRC